MNAKIFIKTKTKQINLRRNRIGALNCIDSSLFTNNRDRKWRMSVLGFFQSFSCTYQKCKPNVVHFIRFYFTRSNLISNSTSQIVPSTQATRELVSNFEYLSSFLYFLSLFQRLKQTERQRSFILFHKNDKKFIHFSYILSLFQRLKQTDRRRFSFVLFQKKHLTMATCFSF